MFKSTGRGLSVCLVTLIIGIVIGGTIDARIHHNKVHLQVSPLGGLNVSPEVGDVIDWKSFGNAKGVTIHFEGQKVPCNLTNDNKCKIESSAVSDGFYLYTCNSGYGCSDPGVGPITTTGPGSLFGIVEAFKSFLLSIKQFFFSETNSRSTVSTGVAGSPGITGQGPKALPPPGPYQIDCTNGSTNTPPDALGSLGKTIDWGGPQKFKLTMTNVTCTQSTSASNYAQHCTLASVGPPTPYTYTATVDGCSESASAPIVIQ